MAAYAGFLEHTDEQIGRVIGWLKESKLFDSTAIFFLSDNGGAPEAATRGGFARPYGDRTTVEEMYQRLDELGGETTQPLYQRPWAMVSDTPFKCAASAMRCFAAGFYARLAARHSSNVHALRPSGWQWQCAAKKPPRYLQNHGQMLSRSVSGSLSPVSAARGKN